MRFGDRVKSRIAGISLCALLLSLSLVSIVSVPAGAVVPSARIGIYSGTGAEPNTVLALYRMFAAMGHQPMAIWDQDIKLGRLTTANFDILVIPAGQGGSDQGYADKLTGAEQQIRDFVNSGGGFIGIEAGARYASATQNWNGTLVDRALDLYAGQAVGPLSDVGSGMAQISVTDAAFGSGSYTTYFPTGVPYFTLATGASTVATYTIGSGGGSEGKAAIVRFSYGLGRAVLVGPELSLEENNELDWSVWDNLENNSYDPESEWPLMARLVEWVLTGVAQNTTVINPAPLAGRRLAIYATRTDDGGAWPGLLPAVARAVEYSGHTPLAIRDKEIINGNLTRTNFDALIMPGGYAYGYKKQLAGNEQKIRDFVSASGGYIGASAGTFYAADDVVWEGRTYAYPLDLYLAKVEGPLADIALWPQYALTPLAINDPQLGTMTLNGLYWGEGFLHPPTGQTVDVVATFAYTGQYSGKWAMVKHLYGQGRVFQPNMHLEAEEGSTRDWVFLDNWKYDSTEPQIDPETDWDFLKSGYNWTLPAQASAPFTPGGITLPVLKTLSDNTGESLGDAQRQDVSGSSPTLVKPSDGWYSVDSKKTMELTGFGAGMSGTITGVTLKVKYSVEAASDVNSYVQWSTDGTNYSNTTIQPLNGHVDVVATYDLKAAGVDTWAEIQNLRIKYYNNDALADSTSFDYVWVVVTTTP